MGKAKPVQDREYEYFLTMIGFFAKVGKKRESTPHVFCSHPSLPG